MADRLNLYNHYLRTPDYLPKDIERYRGVTPATVSAFVRDQLRPRPARRRPRRQGDRPISGRRCRRRQPPTVGGRRRRIDQRRRAVARTKCRRPVRRARCRCRAPESAQLPNGLTLILSARTGLPVVAANLVVRTGSDANPPDEPGLANFTVAMLDEGTATRSALQIANEIAQLGATLAVNSSMDASIVTARALKKNFAAALDLVADVTLHPDVPRGRNRAPAGEPPGAARAAARECRRARRPDRERGALRRWPSVRVHRNRHRGVGHGDDAAKRWPRSGRQNFVPNNAALVVAGDITMAELRPLAEKVFGGWQRGDAGAGVAHRVAVPVGAA